MITLIALLHEHDLLSEFLSAPLSFQKIFSEIGKRAKSIKTLAWGKSINSHSRLKRKRSGVLGLDLFKVDVDVDVDVDVGGHVGDGGRVND